MFKANHGTLTLAQSDEQRSPVPPSGTWRVNTVVLLATKHKEGVRKGKPETKLAWKEQELKVTDPSQRDRRPANVANITYPTGRDGGRNVPVPCELGPRAGRDGRRPSLVMDCACKLGIAELELDEEQYDDNHSTTKRNEVNHQRWINFASDHRGKAQRLSDELRLHALKTNINSETPRYALPTDR